MDSKNRNNKPSPGPGPMPGGPEKAKDTKGTWVKIIKYCRKYWTAMIVAVLSAGIGTVLTVRIRTGKD